MNKYKTRWFALLILAAVLAVGLSDVLVLASDAPDKPKPRSAWQPPEVDHLAYRDIVDYNIFRADRRRIAQEVDRERNPPTPSDPTPRVTVPTVDKPPPNPDSFWRLAGITHTPDGVVAFIEHTQSGELARLTGPAEFSKGEVTAIGLEAVMYVVEDEQRVIQIGQTLVGERVLPTGSSSKGSSSKNTSNLSAAERLRLLREKRAREQNPTPPADNNSQAPEPEGTGDATRDPEPDDDLDRLGDDSDPTTGGSETDADNNP